MSTPSGANDSAARTAQAARMALVDKGVAYAAISGSTGSASSAQTSLRLRKLRNAKVTIAAANADTEGDAEKYQLRVRPKVAHLQRRAQPHEEQRAEESLSDTEELPGESAWRSDRGHRETERKAGQHYRYVGVDGEGGQR